jgi:hypothetical protein
MLQLIRTFLANVGHADEMSSRRMVLQALFKEAGVRAHRFAADEQRSLVRLCRKALRLSSDSDISAEALQQLCFDLANVGFVYTNKHNDCVFEEKGTQVFMHEEGRKIIRVSLADALDSEEVDQRDHEGCNAEEDAPTSDSNIDSVDECKTTSTVTSLELGPPQLKIKNTFIEDVEKSRCRYDPVLSRPPPTEPFDFLPSHLYWPIHQGELDMIQAIREDYQGLRAVQALDIVSCTHKTDSPSIKSKTSKKFFVDLNQLNAFRKDYQECRAVPFVDFSLEDANILGTGPLLPKSMKKSLQCVNQQLGAALSIIPDEFIEELQFIRDEYQQGRAVPALDYHAPWRVEPTKWLANDVNRLSHDIAFKWHHGKQPKELKPIFVKQIGPPLKGLFSVK